MHLLHNVMPQSLLKAKVTAKQSVEVNNSVGGTSGFWVRWIHFAGPSTQLDQLCCVPISRHWRQVMVYLTCTIGLT